VLTTPSSTPSVYATPGHSTGAAIADFIFGIMFICFSFPVLWNNERKQVKIAALLLKAEKECIEVGDISTPKDENNFKLVYASGVTNNEDEITDSEFNVSVDSSVKLIRCVEMF
jgi:hypothetical protein